MNIFLDAFFDLNFGDDLFISTVTSMLPGCKFYSVLEYYPESVCQWAQEIPNLYLLPESELFFDKDMFDAYLCVGGDIFPDGGDFTGRRKGIRSVKRAGGKVVLLGFSLFHDYSEKTKADLKEIFENTDLAAPRDRISLEILREICPEGNAMEMADLAFAARWPKKSGQENCLGISVRRPVNAGEADRESYVTALAGLCSDFLLRYPKGEVKLLCLSGGIAEDEPEAEAVLEKIREGAGNRVSIVKYCGNTEQTMGDIASCSLVLCTRLHAMIACVKMGIPFVPLVYEVKQEHFLEEIGYRAPADHYPDIQNASKVVEAFFEGGGWPGYEETALREYCRLSDQIGDRLRRLLGIAQDHSPIVKSDVSGPVSREKEYARTQAAMVEQKNRELQDLAEEIRKQQKGLEEAQRVIGDQQKGMEEAQRVIGDQQKGMEEAQKVIGEYLNTISEVNQKNQEYFQLIEELSGTLQRTEETLREQLAEQRCRMDEMERVLEDIRPYLLTRPGRAYCTLYSLLLKARKCSDDEKLAEILQYYQEK